MNFRDIIDLWETREALANAVGVRASNVRKWRLRNRIPSAHWVDIVRAARASGFDVTLETLAEASATHKTEAHRKCA